MQDFDGLENMADSARSSKSRFPGGVWKLYEFYQAVSKPVGLSAILRFEREPFSIAAVGQGPPTINNRPNCDGSGIFELRPDRAWVW
jgi:hypothetical protein